MSTPRSSTPRSSMLSASPRQMYKVAPHGRAGWATNFPPYQNPEVAMKTAVERSVQARPWLQGTLTAGAGMMAPPMSVSPRSPRHTQELKPIDWRASVAVPKPRKKEAPQVPQRALGTRWEESLMARRPGQKPKSVQRIFERIDTDRGGTISHEEALKSILAHNLKVKPGEIDGLLRSCDTNGDGVVDFDEFRVGLMQMSNAQDGTSFGLTNQPKKAMVLAHDLAESTGMAATDGEISKYLNSLRDQIETKYKLLTKAFQAADKDASGSLSKAEIVGVVQSFALPIPVDHIHQVFDIADKNGDGRIIYKEFCAMLKPYELPQGA